MWVHPDQALRAWGSLQCAPLGDVDVLAWWAEAAGEPASLLFPHLFLQVGKKTNKNIFSRTSVCCFVLSHGKRSIQENWRSDPAAIYGTARSSCWLQMWGTWRNFGHGWIPIVRGHSEQYLFIQYPFLLIIKEFRKKVTSSLKVFVLLNKYTEWKCPVLKDTFVSNGLCWEQTQRKSQLCNLCYSKD